MRGADRRLAAGLVFALIALCLLPSAVARGVGSNRLVALTTGLAHRDRTRGDLRPE